MRLPVTVIVITGLLAVPSAATAAKLRVEPVGTGETRAVLRALPGESNYVTVDNTPDGLNTTFAHSPAPLTVGAGCVAGSPAVCSSSNAEVFLGDRADRASVFTTTGSAFAHGGEGDDDVTASGRVSGYAWGDSGDDTIRVNSTRDAVARGGSGNDRILGPPQGPGSIIGDSGHDLLVHGGFFAAVLTGGSGDDQLVGVDGLEPAGTMDGGSDDDVLTFLRPAEFSRWSVTGGSGRDQITGSGGQTAVDAGPGNDRIDVTGGTGVDTVVCGRGFDTVYADPEDEVAADCERRASGTLSTREITAARERAAALIGATAARVSGAANLRL